MIYRARAYCHNCRKNVSDLTLKDREMPVNAYCPGNPNHQVTVATWTEKERDPKQEEERA